MKKVFFIFLLFIPIQKKFHTWNETLFDNKNHLLIENKKIFFIIVIKLYHELFVFICQKAISNCIAYYVKTVKQIINTIANIFIIHVSVSRLLCDVAHHTDKLKITQQNLICTWDIKIQLSTIHMIFVPSKIRNVYPNSLTLLSTPITIIWKWILIEEIKLVSIQISNALHIWYK